ncbi:MAG: proline--tRNA ligase [Phycisphaerae bacterium]|nr:proline--tRNA ligase [Phycisphaerae bacterium]
MPPLNTSSRGDVHRWSQTLIPTAREAPTDAETPSHILLSRAGFIRKVAAGVYDYLPLAWRTLGKIMRIVREEMNAAGAAELFMPVLVPFEFYRETKRDQAYGDLLFRVTDRKGNLAALGPTHEETITELVKGSITSYKQLPLNLYQIQTKFRDEARPRAGLLRCREFIMKDAYSFTMHVEGPGGLNEQYDAMYAAYNNIFRRCGLDFTVVEAESGPIGGSASHEFMVNCASGEDTILKCPASGYAANVEKCEIGERSWSFDTPHETGATAGGGGVVKHHTPNLPGIDEVAGVLKVAPRQMLKTIVFEAKGPARDGDPSPSLRWILATVRGDHDANEGKVKAASGCAVALADEKAARAAGFAIGYVSPRMAASAPGTLLLIDPDAATGDAWATGADEKDYHVTNFRWKAEMGQILADNQRVKVADIRNALPGDPSPRAKGATLEAARGIEVGHIFKLGTKYSDAMGLTVLDDKQQRRSVIMGCYGIGVSRTMAACVEMSHDTDGIVWPAAIAPYHVLITLLKPDHPEHAALARRLADDLASYGADVLIDDRDERPGVKFKDADLVGFPVRLTVGEKALAEGGVEFKARKTSGKGSVVKLPDAVAACLASL